MSEFQLLIHDGGEKQTVALLENGVLIECHREEQALEHLVGSIFLGRVERVLPDVKAAFVRLGLPLNGFLPLKEAESYHRTTGSASLMSGQEILVQVKKAPKGGKGAFLTRDIAFPGQYVLLMPCNRFIGTSRRIEREDDRNRAKQIGQAVADGRFGLIVRHAALFADEAAVREEAEQLWGKWQGLYAKSHCIKAPAQLYAEEGIAEVLARDYGTRHHVERCESDQLWERYRVEDQISAALSRRVDLPHGGSLVVDEREALQTIDVNSGRTVTRSGGNSLAFEENLRAVPEIARQIRLRNLSGIILIDFIDMETDREREEVAAAMARAVADDRIKNVIHGFTRLGLLEMTRKRTSPSLRDQLTEPCKSCCETGRVLETEEKK